MKKYTSVFSLYARMVLPRLLFTLAGLVCANCILCIVWGFPYITTANTTVENAFGLVFIAAYLLLVTGCIALNKHKNCSSGLTLQRLNISEFAVFICHIAVCFCCILILWLTETAVLSVLGLRCSARAGFPVGLQGVMMPFYRSRILHGLLPLAETSVWVRNLILCAGAAVGCGYTEVAEQYRIKPLAGVVLLATIASLIPISTGSGRAQGAVTAVYAAILALYCVVKTHSIAHLGNRRTSDAQETE